MVLTRLLIPLCVACLRHGASEMALPMTIFLAQRGSNYYHAILSADFSLWILPFTVFAYYRINPSESSVHEVTIYQTKGSIVMMY